MTRRPGGALLVALVVVVVALTSCSSSGRANPAPTTTDTGPTAPRVLVLGDSNLFEAGADVDAALRDTGYEPTLRGVPGLGLKDLFFWLEELAGLLKKDPRVVVVGLGTNDTTNAADVMRFPDRLDRMMEELGDRPVIWITHVDDRPAAPASAGRAVNAAIRAAAERWPNLTVLDFAVDIAADPSILRFDGLHFSRKGMRIYAREIVAAVTSRLALASGRG